MKLFIAALPLLFTFSIASAAPGSMSHFTGTYVCGKSTDTLQTKYTVLDETPKDGGGIRAKLLVARQSGKFGQSGEETTGSYVSGEKFQTAREIENYCRRVRGSVEKITAPAGRFLTCKLSGKSNGWATTTWVGYAPLGIVAFKSVKLEPTSAGCYPVVDQKISSFSF